jgi:hypothetical protein
VTEEFAGVTVMAWSGFATVNEVVPVTPDRLAEIVTLPGAIPVASPPPLILAIRLFDDCQFTAAVRFFVLPSL